MGTALGEREEVARVSLPTLVVFPGGLKPLQPELAHRLQHLVARLVIEAGHLPQETLLDQCHDAIEDIALAIRVGHGLRCGEGEAAGEDGEAPESACSSGESRS